MATTPEGKVKKKVVEILKSEGIYYFFPSSNGFGRTGIPDIVCCHNGRFVGIECKAGTKKPTPIQALEIESIRRHGGHAVVVNEQNWDMLRGWLRAIKEGKPFEC